MMRVQGLFVRGILVALLLSAARAVEPEEPQTPEQEAGQAPKELTELEEAASRIRGLKFKMEVDYQVADKSTVRDLLNERINEEFPPGKLEKLSIAYAKLGLIEAGLDLRDSFLSLYSEQIAAFYDQKKKKLYSIKGLPFSEGFQKVIMVHELAHALQDQNFDLSTLPLECKDNDDLALAALSLVEGDATLVFTQYASGERSLGVKDILAAATTGQKELMEAPYVIRKNLVFPYMEGSRFVSRLFGEGGWELINQAFKNPPQSTEQILHPEKYSEEKDDPIPIVLPDFSSLAGKTWELLEDNVLGELNTRVLFTQFLGSIRAMRPSKGWGGDRFHVYRAEGGDETLLVWGTAWDTEKDREEFVSRYLQAMRKKYKGKEFKAVEQEDCTCLLSDDVVIWVGWAEAKALILEAPDQTTLLAMLWEFLKAGGGLCITRDAPSPAGDPK